MGGVGGHPLRGVCSPVCLSKLGSVRYGGRAQPLIGVYGNRDPVPSAQHVKHVHGGPFLDRLPQPLCVCPGLVPETALVIRIGALPPPTRADGRPPPA
ncbi:hypothetical protein MRX96_000692 [Rhipicephalus microplus]